MRMSLFNCFLKMSRKFRGAILLKILYSCDIPKEIYVDPTVEFQHNALGVVIAPNTKIEEGVTIQHHVTLGMKNGIENVPHICKNAVIGAYAIILGKVTIGENAVVGAGTIITKDVPANTIVVNDLKIRTLETKIR